MNDPRVQGPMLLNVKNPFADRWRLEVGLNLIRLPKLTSPTPIPGWIILGRDGPAPRSVPTKTDRQWSEAGQKGQTHSLLYGK